MTMQALKEELLGFLMQIGAAPIMKAAAGVLTAYLTYLFPSATLMALATGVFGLIVIDTLTGLIAARRCGERITSMGMRRTVHKILTYGLFVSSVGITFNSVPGGKEAEPLFIGMAAGWLLATEFKSILENLRRSGLDATKLGFVSVLRDHQDP